MMNFAFWVLLAVGAAASLAGVVTVLLMVLDEVTGWRPATHQKSFHSGQENVRHRLANDAWWFSESPETTELLQELASGVDVADARENWRRARAEREAVAP